MDRYTGAFGESLLVRGLLGYSECRVGVSVAGCRASRELDPSASPSVSLGASAAGSRGRPSLHERGCGNAESAWNMNNLMA